MQSSRTPSTCAKNRRMTSSKTVNTNLTSALKFYRAQGAWQRIYSTIDERRAEHGLPPVAKELLDVATSRKHRSGHNYSAVALLKFLKCVKLNPCPRKRPKPAEVEQLSFSNLHFPSEYRNTRVC